MSIVTKSGTNTFTGEVFEFFRNQAMNRLDKFAQAGVDAGTSEKPKYSRNQWGGALGGPIVRNKLHFFGTYERTDEHNYFTVNALPQFYSAFNGSYRGGFAQNLEMFRFDYPRSSTATAAAARRRASPRATSSFRATRAPARTRGSSTATWSTRSTGSGRARPTRPA